MLHMPRLAAFAAILAGAAAAQDPPLPAPAPDPSVFPSYRPFAEQEVQSWRAANQTVARIGGWRAYLREAQGGPPATSPPQPQAAQPAAAAPTTPPRDPHAGHH